MHEDYTDYGHLGMCYDCGSTLWGHHTPSCEMAGDDDVKDLAEVPGTQYWVECDTGKEWARNHPETTP